MDEDEQARQQLKDELIQVGEEAGMVDSRALARSCDTLASYEAPDGSVHYFDFAPVGSDAVLPAELSQ